MSDWFNQAEQYLIELANVMPIELFIVVGTFIEEVIAPIPSPLIMMTAGMIGFEQNYGLIGLFWLAVVGSASKTTASLMLYFIADKLEDVFLGRWGKFFGIDHEYVESVGQKLHKGGKDYWTIFWLRAIPIVPTAPISVLSGFFKVDLKAYIVSTFAGTVISNIFYLFIGFSGVEFIAKYNDGLATGESYVKFLLVVVMFVAVVWYKLKKPKK